MSAEFQFLRPGWLFALLPFGVLVWSALRGRHRGGAWSKVCDPALLPFVLEHGNAVYRGRPGWLLALAGALAITALAGPVWERVPVPVFRGDSALVIALDLSSSMNAEDLKPSRLARARFKIADILRLRTTGQTALIVFAAQPFTVTPLTDDGDTLAAQLPALETAIMPVQGSAPAAAIERAGELLLQGGIRGGHVLLVTDGGDARALAEAETLAEGAPFQLSVLGVGTVEGAPIPDAAGGFAKDAGGDIVVNHLPEAGLATLARSGRGHYTEITDDDSDIRALLTFMESARADEAERLNDLRSNQWREFGPWLLLPLLPLAALAFRRGLLVLFAAALLGALPTASRADWWLTPDQAGQRAFRRGEFGEAARRFDDPAWRAAARYRAGEFDAALADMNATDGPQSDYNRGNALARLGRLDEALAAYDKALERTPDDVDTLHNKALVEALLKQQQQQQPPPAEQQSSQPDDKAGKQGEERGEEGGESEMSGGQKEQEQRQNMSAGNAGGGAQGEEQQKSQSGDGDRQAATDKQREERAEAADDEQKEAKAGSKQRAQSDVAASAEEAQATEQWLRQIPDDPAGLLRRKFQYQYKQLYGNQQPTGDPW